MSVIQNTKKHRTWTIEFTYKGVEQRKTSGVLVKQPGKTRAQTKAEARAVEADWKRRIDEEQTLGLVQATLGEAMERYFNTVVRLGRTNGDDFKKKSARIMGHFGAATPLAGITSAQIDKWAEGLLTGGRLVQQDGTRDVWVVKSGDDAGLKPRSINAYLTILRCVLRRSATKWNYLAKAPQVNMLKVQDKKLRFLTVDEARSLIAASAPNKFSKVRSNHLQQLLRFLLGTGARKTEGLTMTWDRVHLRTNGLAFVLFDNTKTGVPRQVPIGDSLRNMLLETEAAQKKAGVWSEKGFVFLYLDDDGTWQRMKNVGSATFDTARKAAGLGNDVGVHTLRHTFASWAVQDDVPLKKVSELLGHESVETTEIYAHLAPSHLEAAAVKLEGRMAQLV
jgi:integrase